MRPMHTHTIVLATANARYSHAAFGLRWLWANLGPLRPCASIREFTLMQPPLEIAEALLADEPRIIGLGVYIWNVTLMTQVAQAIKAVRPDIVLVAGGPEISYEFEDTALFKIADYLIPGEADLAFADLAQAIMADRAPRERVIRADLPDCDTLVPPYEAYAEEDLAQRVLYVEASRGCPFRCEFCLSSLQPRVREFPLEPFLAQMARLLERGARQFVFVDRTFNLRQERVEAILRFFLDRWRDGLRLHFEIVPDRLNARTLDLIAAFPPAGLHLEVGVQSFNQESLAAIARTQDSDATLENLRYLRERTGALIHADLVAGLPGETWESFASGFDRLLSTRPHELQAGILKRLKGAPIARHVTARTMAFAEHPPYEILQTDTLAFEQLQRIKRFARYLDLYYNSGQFPSSLALLWGSRPSAFDAFMALSDSIWDTTHRTHEFPLVQLARHLHTFLTQNTDAERRQTVDEAITRDFHRIPGRKDKLDFVREDP